MDQQEARRRECRGQEGGSSATQGWSSFCLRDPSPSLRYASSDALRFPGTAAAFRAPLWVSASAWQTAIYRELEPSPGSSYGPLGVQQQRHW